MMIYLFIILHQGKVQLLYICSLLRELPPNRKDCSENKRLFHNHRTHLKTVRGLKGHLNQTKDIGCIVFLLSTYFY